MSPPQLLIAELLVAPCKANLQEVIYDLVLKPLSGVQSLHAPALDRVGVLAGKFLHGQAYTLGGSNDYTPFLGRQGAHDSLPIPSPCVLNPPSP